MAEEKTITYPKALLVIAWIGFAVFFIASIGSFASMFDTGSKAFNFTEDKIACTIMFFVICLAILLLEFIFYRKKITAGDTLRIRFAFKKKIELLYQDIGKCVFIERERGIACLVFYDINNKKITSVENDLAIVLDFMDFLESKNVEIKNRSSEKPKSRGAEHK